MRHRLVLAVCWALVMAACATGDGDTTADGDTTGDGSTTVQPATTAALTTAAFTTAAPTTTSTTPTTTSPSTTIPSTATPIAPVAGPDYIVTGPDGVFRVADGVAVRIVTKPGVTWAADDGMGGVVYYPEPGVIEHLRADAQTSVTLATDATPNYVTLVNGRASLEMTQIRQGNCDDADGQNAMLVDLTTAERRLYAPCIPLEWRGIHPGSMGGNLALSVDGGGWPDEEPVSARLVFRDSELPPSITTLTGWDDKALGLLAGLELQLPANPWPEPCHWCSLDALLSPDGGKLALAELVPAPTDLGATDWDEFDALDLAQQWQRWEDFRRYADVRLRVVDLETGETFYSELWAGPGELVDFDGRYLIYQFGGTGHHSQFPYNTHLIDTSTGEGIPINWGDTDPGHLQRHISLALPT
ncbi:MAG: hypothetical protein OES24_09390 [Acidimicrobiia bacterium]|nr:hypothetical protein [Acidimicrobiia bacterium]